MKKTIHSIFIITLFLYSFLLFPKESLSFTCYNGTGAIEEAKRIDETDLILKARVLNIVEPAPKKLDKGEYNFSTVILEPIEVYKGLLPENFIVVNRYYLSESDEAEEGSRVGDFLTSLFSPIQIIETPKFKPHSFSKGEVQTIGLKYSSIDKAYVPARTNCQTLFSYNFAPQLQAIQKIEGSPDSGTQVDFDKFKNCKMFFLDAKTNYFPGTFENDDTTVITFKSPATLISQNKVEPYPINALYLKKAGQTFMGKSMDRYINFTGCNQ